MNCYYCKEKIKGFEKITVEKVKPDAATIMKKTRRVYHINCYFNAEIINK